MTLCENMTDSRSMNISCCRFYNLFLQLSLLVFLLLLCFYSEAETLDHNKTPCTNPDDFIPDTRNKIYVFYIHMEHHHDFKTWKNVASCLHMWDLDARGFHKSMWRFWLKKNHVLVAGCPTSEYCSYKPAEVKPIYIPEKSTE